MNNLNRSIIKIALLLNTVSVFAQDINFSSEYNRVSWPVALGLGGGITGDDGSYKRLALYHGGSISLQTGSNAPGISNSRLFIDNNGSVGIGTTGPQNKLEVHGTTAIGQYTNGTAVIDAYNSYAYFGCNTPTNGLAVGPTGNVGIGTTSPAPNSRLDIEGGGLNIGGSGTLDATLNIKTSYGNWDRLTQIHPSVASKPALNLMASMDASLNPNWWSWGVLTSGQWALQPSTNFGGNAGLFIDRSGNVSIGNPNPDAKLTVSGQVHAQEVKVTVNAPGPDYVFEKDYPLTSLEEIKNYIDQNKHLPEVPSAKEMEKNGVQLGEMNMLLLKKIEELTLYVIELKKRDEAQQKEIEILKNK